MIISQITKNILIFGKYIHTYKFNEAVEDEVVLDLLYEACRYFELKALFNESSSAGSTTKD